MRCSRVSMFLVVLLIASRVPVAAGTLGWEQQFSTTLGETGLACSLRVKQVGNESARQVWAEFECGGQSQVSVTHDAVAPGAELILAPGPFSRPSRRGWHPVIVRLHYSDLNGYPFSSVLVHLQAVDTPPVSELMVKPAAFVIDQEGGASRAEVTVTWRGGEPRAAMVSLVAPNELDLVSPQARVPITLDPGRGNSVELEARLGDLLPGSRSIAFLVVECDSGDLRLAGVGPVELSVAIAPETNKWWKLGFLAVLGCCCAAIIVPILKKRRAKGLPEER